MIGIDRDKLRELMFEWVKHEQWIQNGCPNPELHEIRVPGYSAVAGQDIRAYDLYRHSFVPYFTEAKGFKGLYQDLLRLINDANQKHLDIMKQLFFEFRQPGDDFRTQWGNLFDTIVYNGLSHQTLNQYQRKFEVELPLRFLANIRQIISTGGFDPGLNQFRDNSGNLKKGKVIQYIKDGMKAYPSLKSALDMVYITKLRNMISHNSYSLQHAMIISLDGSYILTESEFFQHFDTLHAVQNAVVWLFLSTQEDHSSLESKGVLTIEWGFLADGGYPHLSILQLAPFHKLDRKVRWLNNIVLEERSDQRLSTQLGDAPPIEGVILPELRVVLDKLRQSGTIQYSLIPVMPCIHKHESDSLPHGNFCQVIDGVEGVVPVSVIV